MRSRCGAGQGLSASLSTAGCRRMVTHPPGSKQHLRNHFQDHCSEKLEQNPGLKSALSPQALPSCEASRMVPGASLVAQWLRIRLPMQGTRVRSLVREDPTCRGATKPVRHNF
ncbi:hypothetical protein J1605_008109 [Eschrichtius robustus]|uniref:Uncharacterized protein n=1 Tax=Eschrichtius robustus TaxID=9764 RepID=A0AB34GXB3_ESCRO|nr:hypothetical protein J1605_008109 [Eschrichtius robustus]